MFAAALQQTLACQMLPQLDAKGLCSLACTCKAGTALVASAQLAVWQKVAAELFPGRHAARKSTEVACRWA